MRLSVLIHLYYEDTAIGVYKKLSALLGHFENNINFFINLPTDHPKKNSLVSACKNKLPNCVIIQTSNVGKDIGGKLALMHTYIKLNMNADLLLFLHDKKSPQTAVGENWSDQLFEMIDQKSIEKTLELFNDQSIGMVGQKNHIYNKKNRTEEEIFVGNKQKILALAKEYDLCSPNLDFIGGTMFWVRESIFKDFFKKNDPLQIRVSLERGNVLDDLGPTITHSWERLFGWVVSTYGFKIAGV